MKNSNENTNTVKLVEKHVDTINTNIHETVAFGGLSHISNH